MLKRKAVAAESWGPQWRNLCCIPKDNMKEKAV